ncbi:MAG: Ig-like domain-containing protein, partial [Thiobacillus sp.]|nr:Ig-like domain-containing protein [Thiobacillus sp.]
MAIPRCAFEADAACIVANPNANVAEATPTSAFTDHDDGTVTHIKYLQLPCRWLCAAFAFFVIFAFSEAFAATGPNLITNGNFESGDTGFSSDYSNACPTDIDAGCYKVVIKAQDAHAAWGLPGTNDTFGYSGSGNFFVANGSAITTQSVWKTSSTIAVTQANTNYRFSARLATVYPVSADGGGVGGTNGPKLSFQIGDGTNWVTIGATTAFGTDAVVGDWIQVTIDGKFTATGNYHIRLKNDQTAAAGNDFGLDEVEFYLYSDVTDSTTFNTTGLTGADPDTTAPTLLSTTPSDNATGVAVGSNITLTFDESVNAVTGSINIYKTSDGALVESIDVTSGQVTGSGGATITVNPGSDLTANTEYYILIDATAFDDPAGNSYAGIADTTALSFTTVDTTPTAFTFTAQTGAALSSVATSNTITVAGINSAANISIAGGTYKINSGSYTSSAGTVNNGDTVTVQQTSSGSFSTLTTATLTIGGVAGAFDVTTLAQDTTPDTFTFTAQTGAALSSVATSDTITVAGINSAANISIAGGIYSINGGAYVSAPGTVNNGQTVTVRQTASASYSTLTTATLTIGGIAGAFDVTTLAAPAVITSYTAPAATGTGDITASFTGGGAGCGYTVSQFIPLTGHTASPPAGTAPVGFAFPHGLFDFTTGNCTPGSTITMVITYPQALPAGTVYWKYGPTPTDGSYHWYQLPATISGNTATF